MTLEEIRRQYPQYGDMSDQQLADSLYAKHYSDMPRGEFDLKVGLKPAAAPPSEDYRSAPAPDALDQQAADRRRALQVGVQGAGAGLAELAAMPLDLAAGAQNIFAKLLNTGLGTEIPMATPASEIIREGASRVLPTIDPETMSSAEKGAYNINRFGSQAAGAIPALVKAAATRSAEIVRGSAPKWYDSLVHPYMGEAPARTVVGDAAAAAGSGIGVTAAEEYGLTDGPMAPVAATLASLGGGVGGVGLVQGAETAAVRSARAAGKPFGGGIDKTINVDPETGAPVSKAVADAGALRLRSGAHEPDAAGARIAENRAELQGLTDGAPMPTPAQLSEDPGLSLFQRTVDINQPVQAAARNREFASSVRDTIDRVAPEGADPRNLQARAQAVADERMAAADQGVARAQERAEMRNTTAQRQVEQAAGRQRGVDMARGVEADAVERFAGEKPAASARLDEAIVDQGYIPARERKNEMFDTAPGRNEQLPADEVLAAVDIVRARNNALRPDQQLPGDLVERLDGLRPRIEEDPVTGELTNAGGPGTARGADLADTRKFISTAIERARAAGNFDMADALTTLRGAINRTLEAAPGYTEANQNYQAFAGTYRPGPKDAAAQFTRAIDRDPTRSATPPSQTAGRFLQPGRPEKIEALQRVVAGSQDPAAAQAAARDFLLADMAGSGVYDPRANALRPDRLRRWQQQWGGRLNDVEPGLNAEVGDLIRRAERGERLSGDLAQEVEAAQRNLATARKTGAAEVRTAERSARSVQDQIDKGALGLVIGADADKAVAEIMSKTNRTGKLLDELLTAVGTDEQARNGLKAAVRDFLIDKATTGASEKLKPGDRRGPVSQAKLSAIFKEHEAEMARVFSPEEMNALRAGNRALELANIERLRVTSGSDTVEKSLMTQVLDSPIGRAAELAARIKFGMLKTGGVVASLRRATAGVTGGPDPAEVTRLLERAAVDPDLMILLLGRKIPVGSPAWNKKVSQLLGVAEGARETND